MRRLLGLLAASAMVLSTFAMGSFAPTTHATEFWCEDDPPVLINNVKVNINIGVRSGAPSQISGNVQIIVVIPDDAMATGDGKNMPAVFLSNGARITGLVDLSFQRRGSADGESHGGNKVTVKAMVPGDPSFGTRLSTSRNGQTDVSTSGNWMSVSFSVGSGQHGD